MEGMSNRTGGGAVGAIPGTVTAPDASRARAFYVRNTQSCARVGARGRTARTPVSPTF